MAFNDNQDVLSQNPTEDILLTLETTFSKAQYEMLKTRESFGQATRMTRKHPNKPYQFLKIWTLRKYLEVDLRIPDPPFDIDLERQIDDFIFMCFLTGNDFLPHIPSIEIHEGAINLLISVYKAEFKKIGGYLVNTSQMKDKKAAYIKVKHVERFILAVGSFEEKIFEKRQKIQQQKQQRLLRQGREDMGGDSETLHYPTHENTYLPVEISELSLANVAEQYNHVPESVVHIQCDRSDVAENTKALTRTLRNILREKADLFKQGSLNDKVRLGLPGWRLRYYKEKFSAATPQETENLRKELVIKYTEGLCWVLQYYFAGVCSWGWFYPFHYGPPASDIKGLNCSSTRFTFGAPFKPFDQLMAVLPPKSAHALPKSFQPLMTDQRSTLKEFYPNDFEVDVDGKRYLWQGIVKLPFITEGLLITETRKLEAELDENERERNSTKLDKIFLLRSHDLGADICFLYHSHKPLSTKGRKEMDIPLDCNKSGGMNGWLCLYDNKPEARFFSSPVKGMVDIMDDRVVSAFYKNPTYHDHVPRPLENVVMPLEEITESDIVQRNLWHEQQGKAMSQRRREHQQHHGNVSNAARNSSASPGTGREVWKPAGSGWGGRGRGASEGPSHQWVPRSPFAGGRGSPSAWTGNASRPSVGWRVAERMDSCAESSSANRAVDGGNPWRTVAGRNRGGHGGAANGYAAGRGRGEGSAFFRPPADGWPADAGGSGRGGRAETRVGPGHGRGRGWGGEGRPRWFDVPR